MSYSIGTNRIFYKATDFAAGKTVTAYIWSPTLIKSGLQTLIEIESGLYFLDYDFADAGDYVGVFFENGVKKGFGIFRVISQADDVTIIKNILEGDCIIDKTDPNQWKMVVKNKDTGAVLMTKDLNDVDGVAVKSVTTVIGQIVEPES
jgi:hypothetical protein